MKKLIIFLIGLPIALIGLNSCEKWLSIKPADRIIEDNIFNSEAGFYSALNGVYNELLKSDLYGFALGSEFIEILAQQYNIRPANADYTLLANYNYTSVYGKQRLESIWDASFKAVLNCNKIIENADTRGQILSRKAYNVILGESLALRAFLHFDMLRLFGPLYNTSPTNNSIPYVDKITVSPSPLLPANEVITKILNDLDNAESLLKESDPILVDGPQNDVIEGADNTYRFRTLRLNYYAVLALKARVYLYAGDKVNALKYAKLIIEDTKRTDFFPFTPYTEILSNVSNPDRMFSSEVIFGLYHTNRNSIFQNYFNPEASIAQNLLIPRAGNIATLFSGEESDYRYDPIWKVSNLEANVKYCTKYRIGETPALYRNNIMPLIRLGEVYLIAAEASPNDSEAYGYLNKLRNQRGLTDISDNLSTRIKNEYIKELYGEGQLFFFYKRNQTTPIRSGISNSNVTMNATKYVPVLPDSENRYRNNN